MLFRRNTENVKFIGAICYCLEMQHIFKDVFVVKQTTNKQMLRDFLCFVYFVLIMIEDKSKIFCSLQ